MEVIISPSAIVKYFENFHLYLRWRVRVLFLFCIVKQCSSLAGAGVLTIMNVVAHSLLN